jgi:short-subunit dehydrogenase
MGTKVALVTGASSGIGKATVRKLLQEGFIVYGAARRIERMLDLEREGAKAVALDLTEDASIKHVVDQVMNERSHIDVLVNNAGYGSYGAIEDVPLEEGRRQFEVNLFGLARITQLVLPHMRKNNYGKIVNITSMGGKIYTPLGGWYHATKHALEGFSDCLRNEVSSFGIDVVIVEPGAIKTEWGEIAIDGMVKTSGEGAYADLTHKTANLFKKTYADPNASDPDVVAKVIVKAVTVKKPKTRYVIGHMAAPYLFMRKVLSDRAFDCLLGKFLK